jgi:hypothetical protein
VSVPAQPRRTPALSLAVLALALVWAGSGCASVSGQSAVRLAGEAQLTSRAISDSLERTRRSLETFVEGQVLHAQLTGRSALSPSELCSIRAVQRSLRQRVLLLRKLALLYDGLTALVHYDTDESPAVFDEVTSDLDRYELLPDTTPGPTCPNPQLEPPAAASSTQAPPPPVQALSQSSALRQASRRIRKVLTQFHALWEREQPIYLSIQRRAFMSQKTLTRSLFVKYGLLTPGAVFAPQLAGLGLEWNESAYRSALERWPVDKQAALKEAVLAVLERRTDQQVAEEEARYLQHAELLRVLYRQHQVLEEGLPLDLHQLASSLVPVLRSVDSSNSTCKTQQ